MKPHILMPAFVLAAAVVCSCMSLPEQSNTVPNTANMTGIPFYKYKVVNRFPHDSGAYTQGLSFYNGALYESTGLYGRSSLRKVDLSSGNVTKIHQLPSDYWGEGITIYDNKVIQLTWKSGKAFVYDLNSFELLRQFSYQGEGWGLTSLGNSLIMSNGTAGLYFLDPDTFNIIRIIEVHDIDGPIGHINELEIVNGLIYANIWGTNLIAIINPADGSIAGWLDLTGLLDVTTAASDTDVLNGIAYDQAQDRLFVTGKLWPRLFEIKLIGQ